MLVDETLKNFWKDLKSTEFYMDDDDEFFELSGGNRFFGEDSEPSKLFIRKCYNDLIGIVFNDDIRKSRISGNPGIGKTFFGYYLLYHLAILDKTVIYETRDLNEQNKLILFEQNEAFYLCKTQHALKIYRYLDDTDVWYIVDGKGPLIVDAKTILICSPLKAHLKEFSKYIPDVRYMPVWSWDEINTCRGEIFGHLSVDKVHKLFKEWGGIPMYVLADALSMEVQLTLGDAIELCDEKIFRYFGGSDSKYDVSDKLVHIWTNLPAEDDDEEVEDGEEIEPYTNKIIRFASDYVVEQVTMNVRRMITGKLFTNIDEVLNGREGNSIQSPILDSYFEAIAHQMLRRGGVFDVRSLDSNESYKLTLHQQDEHKWFSKIDDIEDTMYYQPIDKTFPSIDAIISPKNLFQMTIALNHPINMICLNKLRSKLASTGEIDFFFVVPAQLYDKYQKQNYATTKGVIATNIKPWINDQIKQYVLKIDLDSGDSTIEEGISNLSTATGETSTPKRPSSDIGRGRVRGRGKKRRGT